MKKKIAIVIRGQVRTWNFAKHSIFEALKPFEEAHDVVYFFVTWDKSYVPFHKGAKNVSHLFENKEELSSIAADFSERVLGKFLVLNYDEVKAKSIKDLRLNEEYEYISFIRYAANLVKQNYEIENQLTFDEVIELRPDIFLLPQDYDQMLELALNNTHKPFSVSLFGNLLISDIEVSRDKGPFVNDVVWISDSLTSDIICSEFLALKESKRRYVDSMNPHAIAADYLMNCKIIVLDNAQNYFKSYGIVRPIEFIKNAGIDFNDISMATLTKIEAANASFQFAKERYFTS